SVSIGGVDLRDIGTEDVLSLQSHVFQHNHIVSGSLSDNVRLGRPDATDEEVGRAVDLARCRDIVDRLPDGMDTVVGPGGVHLSGGEVQRISIARAVLRDTPIVVMDEATAFVDPENEHLIQEGFSELARGRTVLLIAHRLSTVRNADRICVMDRGRIVQSGTHDELVSVPGRYLDMWTEYNRSLGWRIGGCGHDRS
ncbi:MAG: ABC transporter ATP-binding protein, partial [Candidatus Methanomethylophilaceae archaeon]|nr:ABC transporter ATP-binding protein [Candidatus Methanomethylophilaceae archaeon]